MTKDIYTEIAMKIFKIPAEEVTPEQRDSARTIAFAHLYGRRNDSLASWLPQWLEELKAQTEDEVRRLEQERGLEHSLERIKTLGRLRALDVVLSKIREEEGGGILPEAAGYTPTRTCPHCGGMGQFDDHIDDEVDNYYCLRCERDFLVLVGGE